MMPQTTVPRLLLPLTFLLASALAAQGVRLAPIADATLDQQNPNANSGTSQFLDFGKHFATINGQFVVWFKRGLVQFDLTPLQGKALPLRATFWWNQDRSRTVPAGCLPVTLHRLTQPWNETAATWATAPTFDAQVIATESVGGWDCSGWHAFDVTSLVHGWLRGTWANHGFVVRDQSESTAGAARPGMGDSRETANAGLAPYLELRWDQTYGSGCGTPVAVINLSSGDVALGATATLTTSSLAANSPVSLLFGISNTTWAGVVLPYDLGPLGYPACSVLASGEALLGGATTGGGVSSWPIPIPNNPTIAGADFYVQAVTLQAGILILTNGLALRPY